MSQPATILLAYASVGSGHRIAAEAVAEQVRALSPYARVEMLDVLEYGSFRISGNLATSAFTGPTAPLYDAVWGSSALGRSSMRLSGPAFSLLYRRFYARLADLRPDAVVATHSLAATLALRASHNVPGLAAPAVVAVATDFGLHGFWPHRGLALFCVADDAETQALAHRRSQAASVAVTGIPVRAQFEIEIDRRAARTRLGLPADDRVVLALAGATQPGPYARFKDSLSVSLPALAGLADTTIAIVTGRYDAFADDLRRRVAGFGATNVRVLGYVDQMASVMAAADLAVCKPGGLVTAECVSQGLPMVLIGPAAGQERANAEALTAAHAAVYEGDPRGLSAVVRKTLSRAGQLGRMHEATTALQHPHAARAVAERVLALTAP